MRGKGGLTVAEVVVTVLLVAALLGILWLLIGVRMMRAQEEGRRIRCRNNLNSLAKGMYTYLNEHGGNRYFPFPLGLGASADDFNGAEWLAALYWSGVRPDPQIFLCPSTIDRNARGRDIGSARAAPTFGSQTVSYAAMHYRSGRPLTSAPAGGHRRVRSYYLGTSNEGAPYIATSADGRPAPGALADTIPPNWPMASDDTQGSINHGRASDGGMCILFFDSHVEFRTNTEIDLDRGVGRKGGLLWQLRN
ncbi:hypothetical protein ACFL09_05180 [Planctomycetota bacterium]